MSIEIRNLAITSKVVQRQPDEDAQGAAGDEQEASPRNEEDWRAECRRMILELLEQRRER